MGDERCGDAFAEKADVRAAAVASMAATRPATLTPRIVPRLTRCKPPLEVRISILRQDGANCERDQIRFGFLSLADLALRVGSSGVEVSHVGVAQFARARQSDRIFSTASFDQP